MKLPAPVPKFLQVVVLLGSLSLLASSQIVNPSEPSAAPKEEKPAAIPPERNSVTHHEILLGGCAIRYSAIARTLLIDGEDSKPYGSVFYVAYTEDGVTDPRTRPVTFLYNGGPGSASIWLHMGSVGPMRVVTASPKATGSGSYQLVSN